MIARTKTFNHSLNRCFVQSLLRNLGRVALTALFLIPTLRASSPNDLPSLGDSSSRIVSPQMEQRIGEIFLKQLHAALPLSKDVLIQGFGKSTFFKTHDWVIKLDTNSKNRPKASLHKGFPQRGWAAERPTPFVGGGQRPPPLWRLAFDLFLEFVLPSI